LTSDHYFKQRLNDAVRLTYNNQAGVFNFAYNYGGRAEIIHAARQLLAEGAPSDNLLEQKLESHCRTSQHRVIILDMLPLENQFKK
jgi:undecaprenyl diphosphate synthase